MVDHERKIHRRLHLLVKLLVLKLLQLIFESAYLYWKASPSVSEQEKATSSK